MLLRYRFAKCCVLFVTFAAAGVALPSPAVQAAAKAVSGRVSQVTLYRGQAMVTRTIALEKADGSLELVVGDLPENVVGESLFAEGGEGVEIRAVRYRTRAVGDAPREDIRKLDAVIDETNDKIALNQKEQELLNKRSKYLDDLEGFVAPTAKTELSKGVLDAKALQEISTFSFEQRKLIATEQIKLAKQAKELAKELSLHQRQRAELTDGASKTVREAILFLEKRVDEPASVKLNYLVNNCGWSPAYTIRAGKDQKQIEVEYNAVIQQLSGEDWSGVALTLSTASPALSAARPGLAPFRVMLQQNGGTGKGAPSENISAYVQNLRGEQRAAIMLQGNSQNFIDNARNGWTVNSTTIDFQCLELTGGKDVLRVLKTSELAGDGPSLSYRLDTPVSVASRADQQMVRVLQAAVPSKLYHVATPVLSSYVYREAELTNNSPEDLLAGPMSVYLDGRFVGRGEIPTVARGETFVVGFGADPQLRTRREVATREEDVQGGNRELVLKYRLVIENYKAEAVPVRVLDRLPYSDDTADVRVTMLDMDDQLSDDALYQRLERPKGILRWEVTAAASASGEKARMIEYGYKVEYDRNFHLATNAGGQGQLQEEFEKLERARQKR